MKTVDKAKILTDVGIDLSSTKNINVVLEKILLGAMELTDCDAGSLYLLKNNCLTFEIVRTKSLGIAMGGTTDVPITFPPIPLTLENGEPNAAAVVANCIIEKRTLNINNAYTDTQYNFSGTKKFDQATGYLSESFLTIPMIDHEGDVIGALQLINAMDWHIGKPKPFGNMDAAFANALTSQASILLSNRFLINRRDDILKYNQALNSILRFSLEHHSEDKVLDTAFDRLIWCSTTLCRCSHGGIFLVDANKHASQPETDTDQAVQKTAAHFPLSARFNFEMNKQEIDFFEQFRLDMLPETHSRIFTLADYELGELLIPSKTIQENASDYICGLVYSNMQFHGMVVLVVPGVDELDTETRDFFGSICEILGSILNRFKMEYALREAQQRAEQANIAKSEFLANMSHEIRTPMNAVLGLSELLAKTSLNDKQHDYLKSILSSGRHLLGLINDILDYSKIEANQLFLEAAPFDLEELIVDTCSIFATLAEKKCVGLFYPQQQEYPYFLVGDIYRLRQVLTNLLGNALKFTKDGKIGIEISADWTVDPVSMRLAVVDTGIGIPAAAIPKLFTSFSQVDTSTTRKFGGTGLGLSICDQLVKLMGSEIKVTSQLGKGSSFAFTIALQRGKKRSKGEQLESQRVVTEEELNGIRGARILVVEDNVLNQQVAREMLEAEQFVIEIANDGRESIEMLGYAKFDLVLMDILMPGIDGYETTKLIRKDPQHTNLPIIALTANAMASDHKAALAAGMNDYMSKPFHIDKLLSLFVKWVPVSNRVVPVLAKPAVDPKDEELPDTLPGIDIAAALNAQMNNKRLVKSLLSGFSREYRTAGQDMHSFMAANNIPEAICLAHSLKSVFGNLGASSQQAVAANLESTLKQQPEDVTADMLTTFAEIVIPFVAGGDIIAKMAMTGKKQDDAPDLANKMVELSGMLEDRNPTSLKLWEDIQGNFMNGNATDAIAQQLYTSIDCFDFDSAYKHLESLAEAKKIQLGGTENV